MQFRNGQMYAYDQSRSFVGGPFIGGLLGGLLGGGLVTSLGRPRPVYPQPYYYYYWPAYSPYMQYQPGYNYYPPYGPYGR